MFEMLVVGPLAPRMLGVARSCVECRRAEKEPRRCEGFGSGCLVPPRAAANAKPARR